MTKNLTPKQVLALDSLAIGGDVAGAARAAGVSRTTVYRWQEEPTFAGELRARTDGMLDALARRVLSLGDSAGAALADGLDSGQPIQHRLRAAALVCQHGPALAEITDILRRLAALEAKVNDEPA